MGKYDDLAKEIVKDIGTEENVTNFYHCITRLRFTVKDGSKVDLDELNKLDGVVTAMKNAGQYHVVIGNHVGDVYEAVLKNSSLTGNGEVQEKGEIEEEKKSDQNMREKIAGFVSGIMNPVISIMAASGVIKGFLALFISLGWVEANSGTDLLFTAIGDALFYFLPVLLGFTTAKYLKMNEILGAVIGLALVYPTIQNVDLLIFGQNFNVSYTSTVIPVVITVLAASFLYKWLNKVIPDVVRSFVVPIIVLVVIVPIGFMILGPIANWLSDIIANGITSIYDLSPAIAGILIGALWQVLVIFGVHHGLVAVALIQLTSGQPTPILALMFFTTFAQTAVVAAIWLKTKNKRLKALSVPAIVSGIFGVTEPAIYGITLPRIKYFVISCIGAALGGAYAGLVGLTCYQMSGLGVFAILGLFPAGSLDGTIALHIVIGLLISMIFSFVATYMMYSDKEYGDDK